MHKRHGVLIPLLAIGAILFIGYDGFGWKDSLQIKEIRNITNSFTISNSTSDTISDTTKDATWTVFQNYLEFARTHNLEGIKSLSHQISATCTDPSKETECFALMDSVYAFASTLELSQFTHMETDLRQTILYTDGPVVAIIYFTKDASGTPKILGMRFCFEEEVNVGGCVETDPDKRDLDRNGWWDSVESLFY